MAKQSLGILEKKLAQQPPSAKTIVADEQRPLSKEQAINKSLAEFETQNRPKKESIVKQQDQKEIPQGVLAKKEIEQAPPPSPSADSGPKPAGAGYAS
ncbi:MAG: hypothetical protein NT079_01460, partial [Candidatus Omnitrophica bacterium]|nr:hypothetical protein [Candidatus Omnitrophota bacterium]